MARSKNANAIAVARNNLPVNWEAQMRADAAGYKEAVANIGVGQFMSTRGGVLTYQQTPVPGNKMRVVILDAILVNAFYPGSFDPDNPVPPVCWAFGRKESEMAPTGEIPDQQNDACSGCKQNKFGSAEKGRGKACKNGVRLGVLHADSLKGAGIAEAAVAFLNIPPTSLPSWSQYVKSLEATTGLPPYGVVTEIALVPDAKTQFKLTFTLVEKIKDRKLLGAVFAKHGDVAQTIDFAFQPADETAKPAKRTKKKEKQAKRAEREPRQPRANGAAARSKF